MADLLTKAPFFLPAQGEAFVADQHQTQTRVMRLLADLGGDDPHAAAELLPLVYEELRDLADQRMRHEPGGLTLQPTALVHEGQAS